MTNNINNNMARNLLIRCLLGAAAVVALASCSGGNKTANATAPDFSNDSNSLRIVYVRNDSLLMHYNLYKELSEANLKQEENIRATLNAKQRELEKAAQDFQYKLENNAYTTRERAEQEQAKLVRQQQELQSLNDKLLAELANEAQTNMIRLTDSIQHVLDHIRTLHGYDMIISDPLNARPDYDITPIVLEELNKRYPSKD